MIEVIIIEGARGAGKSTVTRKLRETLKSSTLINFTGFPDDGEEGLNKIAEYYNQWVNYIVGLAESGGDYTFICDRAFFSEQVYSRLYKTYNFSEQFKNILFALLRRRNIGIAVFNLTVAPYIARERLDARTKEDHFAFAEATKDIHAQQEGYAGVFEYLREVKDFIGAKNLSYYEIDTSYIHPEAVFNDVYSKLR